MQVLLNINSRNASVKKLRILVAPEVYVKCKMAVELVIPEFIAYLLTLKDSGIFSSRKCLDNDL